MVRALVYISIIVFLSVSCSEKRKQKKIESWVSTDKTHYLINLGGEERDLWVFSGKIQDSVYFLTRGYVEHGDPKGCWTTLKFQDNAMSGSRFRWSDMINVDVPHESLRNDISKNYKGGKSPYSLRVNQPFNPFEGGITVEFFEQEHEDRNLPEINSCDKDTLKTYLSYYLGYSALEEHNFVSFVNGQ